MFSHSEQREREGEAPAGFAGGRSNDTHSTLASARGRREPLKKSKTVLVLPAYNEGATIREVIREAQRYVDELIVVDDGSGDDTTAHARKAGARVLRHRLNLGKAGAMKTGCDAALELGAEIILLMDSDGQHLPKDIPRFIELIEQGGADIVIGARSGEGKMPFIRKSGNRLLEQLAYWLFDIHAKDIQSGFRAFRAEHYPLLRWSSRGYHADAEITIRAGKHHLRHKEIPIETIYHDPHKGMTILDGFGLILQILIWKITL